MSFMDELKEVRAIIAVALVVALIAAVFVHLLEAKELVPLVAVIVGFFFASKNGNGNS